jgi:putative FmdB family regulatory protein
MPIYEYKCRDCGAHIEKRQGVSEEPLKVCEKCGGALEKQWSLSGIKFKGEGWYINDYAAKKPVASGTGEKGEKSEKSQPSETPKTESASNSKNDNSSTSKKESAVKKD